MKYLKLRQVTQVLPKMRTIEEAVAEFHAADPATAITETYLRRLVVTGQVPHVKAGNKYLINMDVLSHFLEGQENKKSAPPQQTGVIRQITV